jgi:hypothetical protein
MLISLIGAAAAAPSLTEGGNGSYSLSDSAATLSTRTRAALDATLEPMNFAVRMVAEGRLEDAISTCSRYTFTTNDSRMRILCDDKPPIDGALSGAATRYTNDKGKVFSVTVKPGTDHAIFTYAGTDATQITTYRFTAGGMVVTKEIRSDSLEVPLRWDTHYARSQ